MSGVHSGFRGWLMAAGLSLGAALLVVSVFFLQGNPWNGDFGFHAASWLDVANQWREGIIYPRWMEWANFGFGEPRFIFYPPLSWIIGAALTFVIPWRFVPSAFVVIAQTIAGLSLYALARRIVSEKAALLGAALFAANPYALLDIYHRGAFAEDLACALIPLVVLAALDLCGFVENKWRSLTQASAFFAVAFALVWLSDVPAAIMTTYSAAFIFACAGFLQKSFQPLWRGAVGLALGFGLDSFNLLPVLYEQHWASVGQVLPTEGLLSKGFLFFRDPNTLSSEGIASSLAILLLIVIGIAAIAAYRRGVKAGPQGFGFSTELFRMVLLLAVASTFLMLRPSWIFWKYLPRLVVMQAPWRWLGVLVVPYVLLLTDAIGRRRRQWIWGAAAFVIVGAISILLIFHGWQYDRNLRALERASLQAAIENGRGFEGAGEYYPSRGDYMTFFINLYNRNEKVPRVQILPAGLERRAPSVDVKIEKWTAEERVIEATSQGPALLELRLLNYPAWQMEINGKAITPQHLDTFGQIVAQVQAGESQIRIKFGRTPDRMLGNVISAAILLAVLAAFCVRKEKVKHQQEQNAPSDILQCTATQA